MDRKRFLSATEKLEYINAAQAAFERRHPGCQIEIVVEDETDEDGKPVYQAIVRRTLQ